MGRFCGSVHVRKPADVLVPTLQDVAAARGARFYVDMTSPASSWIPIFPDHAGQDFAVSAMIAERLGTFVVHVLLHDGDVFAYTVYHGKRTLDEFSSDPAYFAAATPSVRSGLHGQPARFAQLIAPGHSVTEVETTLERVRRGTEETAAFLREGERLEDVLERADRELDELKRKSARALAQRDARFQERAAALLGEQAEGASLLVERLVRVRTPAARQLLDDYAAEFQTIVRAFSAPDSIQARLEKLAPAGAEEAMWEFADALALPNALSSYEEIAERAASGAQDASARHVPAQSSSDGRS